MTHTGGTNCLCVGCQQSRLRTALARDLEADATNAPSDLLERALAGDGDRPE